MLNKEELERQKNCDWKVTKMSDLSGSLIDDMLPIILNENMCFHEGNHAQQCKVQTCPLLERI